MGCECYKGGKPVRYCTGSEEKACKAILRDKREADKRQREQAVVAANLAVADKVRKRLDELGIDSINDVVWTSCSYRVMRDGMRVFHDTSRTLRLRRSMYDYGDGPPGEQPSVCMCGCPE